VNRLHCADSVRLTHLLGQAGDSHPLFQHG
jgi:hypothetical protein